MVQSQVRFQQATRKHFVLALRSLPWWKERIADLWIAFKTAWIFHAAAILSQNGYRIVDDNLSLLLYRWDSFLSDTIADFELLS